MKNRFPIFIPDNKLFHLNLNNIIYIASFFFFIVDSLKIKSFESIRIFLLIGIFIAIVVVFISNYYRTQPLNGSLNGFITFHANQIEINNETIAIESIQKLFLRLEDYEDRERNQTYRYRRSLPFYPNLSNGTDNTLNITLKNGDKKIINFQMQFEDQYNAVQPFVLSSVKNNLLTLDNAIAILHLDSDYLVNKFKTELNKKELN
jgi:hypothetical protein